MFGANVARNTSIKKIKVHIGTLNTGPWNNFTGDPHVQEDYESNKHASFSRSA